MNTQLQTLTWLTTAFAILWNSFFRTDLWSNAAGLFCFFVLVVAKSTDLSLPGWIVTVFLFANPRKPMTNEYSMHWRIDT